MMTIGDARLLLFHTPQYLEVTNLLTPVVSLPQPRFPETLLPSLFAAAFSHAKQTKPPIAAWDLVPSDVWPRCHPRKSRVIFGA